MGRLNVLNENEAIVNRAVNIDILLWQFNGLKENFAGGVSLDCGGEEPCVYY